MAAHRASSVTCRSIFLLDRFSSALTGGWDQPRRVGFGPGEELDEIPEKNQKIWKKLLNSEEGS